MENDITTENIRQGSVKINRMTDSLLASVKLATTEVKLQ